MKERVRILLPTPRGFLVELLKNHKFPATYGWVRHIGGGIETGETPEQCGARELWEELQLQVNPRQLHNLGPVQLGDNIHHHLVLHQQTLVPGLYKTLAGGDEYVELVERPLKKLQARHRYAGAKIKVVGDTYKLSPGYYQA